MLGVSVEHIFLLTPTAILQHTLNYLHFTDEKAAFDKFRHFSRSNGYSEPNIGVKPRSVRLKALAHFTMPLFLKNLSLPVHYFNLVFAIPADKTYYYLLNILKLTKASCLAWGGGN